MLANRTTLAVIPARGGSKGIPRKNLASVGGRSLIAHVAVVVRELRWLDHTVLSTDDAEIAREGAEHGLRTVLRPGELATDTALSTAVWRHAWLEAEGNTGQRFDLSVLLQPTSPLRRSSDVTACVRTLIDDGRDVVMTVSPTPAHFAPEKTLTLDEDEELVPYLEAGFTSIRQHIRQYFFLNGYCYAAVRHRIVDEMTIHGPNAGAHVIDRPVVNIDDPFDLEMAEWLLTRESADPGVMTDPTNRTRT